MRALAFRPLSVVVLGLGLSLGVGVAVIWHFTHLVGHVGWTVYGSQQGATLTNVQLPSHPSWWPTIVAFPCAGLLVGVATAKELSRHNWTLTRRPIIPVHTPLGTAGEVWDLGEFSPYQPGSEALQSRPWRHRRRQ